MIVSHIWLDCNVWLPLQDAFFVGLTPKEVYTYFPEDSISDLSPTQMAGVSLEELAERQWYLISRDGKCRIQHQWYYPISPLWNGNSPFDSLNNLEINNLEELVSLTALISK